MTDKFETLKEEIIKLSEADDWMAAKAEWEFSHTEEDPQSTCLCGHHPITHLYWIVNQRNGETTRVGSNCINQFMGKDMNTLYDGMARIKADLQNAPNDAVIRHASESELINFTEASFLNRTKHPRKKLTGKQKRWRRDLNRKIIWFPVIDLALRKRIITEKQAGFLKNMVVAKKSLSLKQRKYMDDLKDKIANSDIKIPAVPMGRA